MILFHFVDHVDWFLDVEPFLYPWNKSQLMMVYKHFNVLLKSVSSYLGEDFYIFVHQGYSLVICVCIISLSGFGISVMLACKMNLQVFSSIFGRLWEIKSYLNAWYVSPVKLSSLGLLFGRVYFFLFNSQYNLLTIISLLRFSFLGDSVLEDCAFLGIYPCLLGFSSCSLDVISDCWIEIFPILEAGLCGYKLPS